MRLVIGLDHTKNPINNWPQYGVYTSTSELVIGENRKPFFYIPQTNDEILLKEDMN